MLRSLEPETVFLSIAAIGRPTYPALKAWAAHEPIFKPTLFKTVHPVHRPFVVPIDDKVGLYQK